MGRVKGSLLDDPGSEIYYLEGESGWEKEKEVKCITACCGNITIPTHAEPIDSIWTDTAVLCKWSMYNFSNHRPI